MKTLATFLTLVAAVSAADGLPKTDSERQFARVEAYLERGREALGSIDGAKTPATKLQALGRARFDLERAYSLARMRKETEFRGLEAEARFTLAETLVDEATIQFARKSLPRAKRSVGDALRLDPNHPRARVLLTAIVEAEKEDLLDVANGGIANERVRQRREALGFPLRDRGAARRR